MTSAGACGPGPAGRPTISVIVPCYRSVATLPTLVDRLLATLVEVADAHEIVLVVDGSPDDTWSVARSLSQQHPVVEALRLSRNFGQHNALLAGIRRARHDLIVTIDDDLQHRPEDLPALVQALTPDIDLVYGVATDERHGFARAMASRFGRTILARGLGVTYARQVSAYRVFRTRLRNGFQGLDGPQVSIDVALSWTTTCVRGVTVAGDARTEGASGYTAVSLVRHFVLLVLGYSILPLRVVAYLGLVCALGGAGALAYVLIAYVVGYTEVPGFTAIASMIALFSGAQMLAIGVVGEYLGHLHVRSTGRPAYVITDEN